MNAKTSKQLARAASALALANYSRVPESTFAAAERLMTRDQVRARRARVLRNLSGSIYEALKARWNATPRPQRAKLRRRLRDLTDRTRHGLKKAQAAL